MLILNSFQDSDSDCLLFFFFFPFYMELCWYCNGKIIIIYNIHCLKVFFTIIAERRFEDESQARSIFAGRQKKKKIENIM